jgi:hypothetical protein
MSARLRSRSAAIALTVGLVLTAAACGGGGSGSDDASPSGKDVTTTTSDTGTGSLPDYKPKKHEFAEVDGSKARFINLLADKGEGVDMDVYWGMDAGTGKKATTIGYGDVSDWMPIEVDKDPLFTPSDGGKEVSVAFYPKGETDRDQLIMQKQESIEGDVLYTFTMGTTKPFGSTTGIPASLGVGYDHEAGKPPAGKAWVALNSIGIGGIEGGDFMVLSSGEGCDNLTGTDIEGGTANSGQAYLVDPGPQSFTASDANTECAERTDPVDFDVADGDQYVIYAYGTSKDDRKLMAVKVGE